MLAVMKRLLAVLPAILATSGHAQGNCDKPEAFRNAFNSALADSYVDVRVKRVVQVQDRREVGCHVIFDMDNGDQIGGMIVTQRTIDAQWIPDEDREPLEYERRVTRKHLILSLADLADPAKPPAEPAVPSAIRARMDGNPKPVPAFNANEICNSIGAGQPPSERIQLMQPKLNDILLDIGKVKGERADAVKKLAAGGLSKKDTDQTVALYRVYDWRVRYQVQLYNVMTSTCLMLWMSVLHN